MKNQKIKLLLTDLDGTLLLNDHETISPRTKTALHTLKGQGVKLCICTGRVLCLLPKAIKEIGFDYIITSNGAACCNGNTNELVFSAYMPADLARHAWSIVAPFEPLTEWYVGGDILMDQKNYDLWPQRLRTRWHREYLGASKGIVVKHIDDFFEKGAPKLEKLNLCERPEGTQEHIIEPLLKTGHYEISSSLGRNLEISHVKANKGQSLLTLCDYLQIDPSQAIAFGDGGNDETLLTSAGIGVAMANGLASIKEKADAITLSNEEEGLAHYLEQYVL